MRELHGFKFLDGAWRAVLPDDVETTALQGDEGVLTGAICTRGAPLPVNGRVYRPLVFGYPDENGIDLLWLADDGRLLITECKKHCVDPDADFSQLCQEFMAYGAHPLSSILRLCQVRAPHQAADAISRLQAWFSTGADPKWSFRDLVERGALDLGVVYADMLPPKIRLTAKMKAVVAAFKFSKCLDGLVVEAGTIGTASAASEDLASISCCAKHHTALLQRNRATSARVHRPVASVVDYYMGLPDTAPAKKIVVSLISWRLSPAAGTGKSEPQSLRLRVPNGAGKDVPLIWFRDQTRLHVEPNIRA